VSAGAPRATALDDAAAGLPTLLAALHLASPALPVGGFAYSEGLETAIAQGLVADEAAAGTWIGDLLLHVLARTEAPLWLRAYDAAAAADLPRLAALNDELLALRETAELRAESQQMGASMWRLFPALGLAAPALEPAAYVLAFACACAGLGVARSAGLATYLWSWLENQVLVAVKSVPLGQQAGQRLLHALRPLVAEAVARAARCPDDAIGSGAFGFTLACAAHEGQYSRLFRS